MDVQDFAELQMMAMSKHPQTCHYSLLSSAAALDMEPPRDCSLIPTLVAVLATHILAQALLLRQLDTRGYNCEAGVEDQCRSVES